MIEAAVKEVAKRVAVSACAVLAAIGVFAATGAYLGWFEPRTPPEKQLSFVGETLEISGSKQLFSTLIPIDPSHQYELSAEIRVLPDKMRREQKSRFYVGVRTFDAAGRELKSGPGTYRYAAAKGKNLSSSDGWSRVSGIITGEGDESHNQFRPGTKKASVVILANRNADRTVLAEIRNVELTQLIKMR
jgi:hypothetical protein